MNSDEISPPAKPNPRAPDEGPVSEEALPSEPLNSDEGDGQAASPQSDPTQQTPSPVRRPLRLSPSLGEGSFKAVPSLGSGSTPSRVDADPPTPRHPADGDHSAADPAPLVPPPAESAAPTESATAAGSVETVAADGAGRDSDDPQSHPASADAVPAPEQPPAAGHAADTRRTASPVDIPPRVGELDAELEAALEAALSGDERNVPQAVEQQQSESSPEVPSEESLEAGAHLTGRIQSIHGDDVFLDVGLRSPAVIPFRQFEKGKRPIVGQLIEIVVERVDPDEGLISCNLPKGIRKATGGWEALEAGQIVECMVTKKNKGGLEVTVAGLRGFLPASQAGFTFVSDLESFVGQKLSVKVLEANPKKRNLVVSHRGYLEIERKESEEALWSSIEEGQSLTGTVKTLKPYGAFVDLGGVDGFLHIGEISWGRIGHPSEVLEEGQQIEVKVLRLDGEKRKISLGMRQLTADPWLAAVEKYAVGSTTTGSVTRIADFGAFVRLEPGVEGLVHISEIDHKRVNKVSDVLKVGQQVDTKVLEIDVQRRRIALSVKALMAQPEPVKPEAEQAAAAPQRQRKRKVRLKGGTGEHTGGGLFGNPRDFT